MILKDIWLKNYRGVVDRHVEFHPNGVTLIVGPNEIGKSSIIEAIDLLFEQFDSSTRQAVRATQPVGRDVATEITLRAETGPYEFTYSKRFHRDKQTQLEIHAPKIERLSGRAAHDRMLAILSETMDDALWKALRVQQGSGITQASLIQSHSLRNALDQAAGGGASTERESDLYAAVKEESELHYSETGNERGALKQVKAEDKDIQARLSDAQSALAAIEHDVAQYEHLERQQNRLEEQEARDYKAIQELKEKLAQVEKLEREIHDLRSQHELAKSRLETIQLQRTERREKAKRVDQKREELSNAEQTCLLLQSEESDLNVALTTRAADSNRLRLNVEREQRETELRQRAAEYLRDKQDAAHLNNRIEQFIRARRDHVHADEAIANIFMTDEVMQQLRTQNDAIIKATAARDLKAPEAHINATKELDLQVTGRETERITEGQERLIRVTNPITIQIPGYIQIQITPGTSLDKVTKELMKTEQQMNQLLTEHSVKNVSDAESKLQQRKMAEQSKREAESRMRDALGEDTFEHLQEQEARIKDRIDTFHAVWPPGRPLPQHLSEAQSELNEATLRLAQARTELQDSEREQDKLQTVTEQKNAQYRKELERQQVLQEQLAEDVQSLEGARNQMTDEALASSEEAGIRDVESWQKQLDTQRDRLEQMQPEAVREHAEHTRRLSESRKVEGARTKDDLLRLRGRLEKVESDGVFETVEELQSRLANKETELANITARAAAARYLYELMKEAREVSYRSYRRPLQEQIVALGRKVYGSTFSVELTDELTIEERIIDHTPVPYESLSAGTKEQLTLMTRIAAAQLVSRDGAVPVFIDDALGFTDDQRLLWMAVFLEQLGRTQQIIILTCNRDRYQRIQPVTIVDLGGSNGIIFT